MKKFLSLALALIMTLSLVTISAGATEYKDFTDKDEIQYEEAVAVLNRLGIITGYSEGDFRPEGELTRGAAAKIIVSLLIGPEAAEALPTTNSPYPDVPAGNVFAGYISFCKTEKIINGYNDGTFRPSGTLTGFAFAKMLLSALGYDGNIEGFTGSGWTVRVSALGSKANLFNRLDFKGGETVNRETACLLALNTLKATMVQYTGGMNITTSDGSTMVVNPTREYVTSNQDYAAHIDNRKVSDKGNSTSDAHYTVEFGEEHFKDLRMDRERENSDQFGRPSNEWSYKKVTIGTYPIAADFTYTTQVIHCVESTTAASKTRALGLSGYEVVGPKEATRDKQTKVWLNGTQVDGISDVSEIADYTDNGTLVEVYVSDEDADFITDVVVVKTQLMEVKRVGSDYVSLDLYDDGSDSEGKAVFGYNSVPIDKKVNDVEVDDDCYNQLKEMKAGDIVAVVPVAPDHNDENTYDVAKVYAPETATGNLSRVETYGKIGEQNAIGVTVGGTAYKIALWNKDLKDINGEVVNLTKKDVTVYLDEYGNALLAKDVGGTKDWMVIKNYRQGLVNGVIVTYVNGWDIDGNEVTLNIGGGSVADYAKANYKPGDLVRYESDSSSNTAEWALSMTESKGVFNVAKFRDDGTTPYTISASNTTIRLDDFDVTAGISANKNLATIDNGIKFIYVSVDKDGEVDGIEFVSGVKSATNDEIIGKDSSALGVKNAQACVSLKDGAVKDSSAVKAVVIKRESTDASVSNLLYISKYLGSATRHDGGTGNNNNIVYSYEVVMMGPGGKLVDDDMTIYSYKNLKIGQFARYTKATAPEGMDGVNNDNFYDLRGYGVDSGSSSADDTFGRSAAVVKATVVESLKQNKYLLKVADYGETTARALSEDPKIAGIYSSDTELDLGDDQAKNLVNARGAAWVDLRDVKDKIDDIDSLKELVNDKNTPVRVTMLFNDNPDSDDFRRVYLIIIHGATTYNPGTPETGNVSIKKPDGTEISDVYDTTVDANKNYKVGETFEIVLKPGYKFGEIIGATLGADKKTFTVTGATVTIEIESMSGGVVVDYSDANAKAGISVNERSSVEDGKISLTFDIKRENAEAKNWTDADGKKTGWVPEGSVPTFGYKIYVNDDLFKTVSAAAANAQTIYSVSAITDSYIKATDLIKVEVTDVKWDTVDLIWDFGNTWKGNALTPFSNDTVKSADTIKDSSGAAAPKLFLASGTADGDITANGTFSLGTVNTSTMGVKTYAAGTTVVGGTAKAAATLAATDGLELFDGATTGNGSITITGVDPVVIPVNVSGLVPVTSKYSVTPKAIASADVKDEDGNAITGASNFTLRGSASSNIPNGSDIWLVAELATAPAAGAPSIKATVTFEGKTYEFIFKNDGSTKKVELPLQKIAVTDDIDLTDAEVVFEEVTSDVEIAGVSLMCGSDAATPVTWTTALASTGGVTVVVTTNTNLKETTTVATGKNGTGITINATSSAIAGNQFAITVTAAPTAANGEVTIAAGAIQTADGYTNTNAISIKVTDATVPSASGTALTWA